MIVSRLAPLAVRSLRNVGTTQRRFISTTPKRPSGGHWVYRTMNESNPLFERLAEGFGAFMWWWIFWHLFTDYEHLIGHFEFPNAECWTDEELGIPPDDAPDPEVLEA